MMKILKFNENNQEWSLDKLKKHTDDREYLLNIIQKYIDWINSYPDEEYIENYRPEYEVYNFFFKDDVFIIKYINADGKNRNYKITKDEISDFIEYLNDPNTYIASKKYNV